MPARVQAQLAIDETLVDDDELEKALEDRLSRKHSKDELSKRFKESHEKVVGLLEAKKLVIPDGGALRVGRFRLTVATTPARSVSFDTEPSTRLKIESDDDE